MRYNKWAYIIGGVLTAVFACILAVGLLNGVWPWSNVKFFDNYKGPDNVTETEQTVESTEDTQKDMPITDLDVKNPANPGQGETGETTQETTQETTTDVQHNDEISFDDLPTQADG